ncbi:hypothetical protein [Riemerella columbipharyngis]|uniref:hypothetical protein n=1 Tax=Riemerella columbipharyngis TaxID=1071918 RepID=UPI0015A16464|nr:hypothetical protein [Riemerella columbipharyngis]
MYAILIDHLDTLINMYDEHRYEMWHQRIDMNDKDMKESCSKMDNTHYTACVFYK